MNKILLFCTILILVSCSKENRIERKLEGNWLATKVRVEDGEGFVYNDTIPKGQLSFDSQNKLVSGKIKFNYSTITLSSIEDSLTLNEFEYQLNAEESGFYADSSGVGYNFRILSLTNNDLQIEYYDLQKYQLKRFILVKN